jgi:hypothetical protein
MKNSQNLLACEKKKMKGLKINWTFQKTFPFVLFHLVCLAFINNQESILYGLTRECWGKKGRAVFPNLLPPWFMEWYYYLLLFHFIILRFRSIWCKQLHFGKKQSSLDNADILVCLFGAGSIRYKLRIYLSELHFNQGANPDETLCLECL